MLSGSIFAEKLKKKKKDDEWCKTRREQTGRAAEWFAPVWTHDRGRQPDFMTCGVMLVAAFIQNDSTDLKEKKEANMWFLKNKQTHKALKRTRKNKTKQNRKTVMKMWKRNLYVAANQLLGLIILSEPSGWQRSVKWQRDFFFCGVGWGGSILEVKSRCEWGFLPPPPFCCHSRALQEWSEN